MGAMPDEEKVFKVIDKDSGRMYDIRNEAHLNHLNESTYLGNMTLETEPNIEQSTARSTKKGGGGWSDWWAKKHQNNRQFLRAAACNDLAAVKSLLDTAKMEGKQADVNFAGQFGLTALHFAARNCNTDICEVLTAQEGIMLDVATNEHKRTPLHVAAEHD